tara:strand:+ start:78673 stop:78843 length:171 start_codon:yes stop_codon:yes gene_type:complete
MTKVKCKHVVRVVEDATAKIIKKIVVDNYMQACRLENRFNDAIDCCKYSVEMEAIK